MEDDNALLNRLLGEITPVQLHAYASRLWHLRSYAACHLHGVSLTDHCEKCCRPLSWSRPKLGKCRCGEPFSSHERAAPSVVQLSHLLAKAALGTAPAPFVRKAVEAISLLAWFFGASAIYDAKGRKKAQLTQASVATSLPILERGASFALDWQPTFEKWAASRFETVNAVGLRWQFEGELMSIRNTFEETCPFVIEALRTYLSTQWQGLMLRKQSYFSAAPAAPRFFTLTQATKLLGITPLTIRGFVAAGVVSSVENVANSRSYLALRADSVETLRRRLSAMQTAEQAGATLGLSALQIIELYQAGHLRCSVRVNRKPRFDPVEVGRFCESLGTTKLQSADAVGVAQTRTVPFVDLVRLIIAGKIKAWFGPSARRGLDNLYVSQMALSDCRLSSRMDGHHVTAKHAARRLGLTGRTLSAFVKALDLSAVWQKRGLIAISGDAIAKWEGKIVTSAGIGAPHGLCGHSVHTRLTQLGISPVMPSSSSQKIAAVWLREAVAHVDFSSQWITARGDCSAPSAGGGTRLIDTATGPTIGPNDVSLVRLQRALNLNRDTLSLLARQGFLEPGGLTSASHLRGVTKASAAAFRRKYVSSTEIARQTGLSAIAVTRRILSHGVKPILQGASPTRYQYCWRRSDLKPIVFSDQAHYQSVRSRRWPGTHAAMNDRPTDTNREAVTYRVAIDYLGTNSRSLKAAVDHGLLRVVKRTLRGGISLLDERDLHEFSQRYAFTPKLSAETGISENALIKAIKLHNIPPVLSGRRSIQSLWERDSLDLGDLLGAWGAFRTAESPSSDLLL